MKRLMMTSYNKILDETKVSGPYPANGITKWVNHQLGQSALGYLTWELRDLTLEEEAKPTQTYVLQGDD